MSRLGTLRKATVAVVALLALAGCGSGGGDSSSTVGGLTVDEQYDFTAAGVQPGVATRDPGRSMILGQLFTDANRQTAVPNIAVTLKRLTTSSRALIGSISTITDADGNYVFGNVEPGSYRVEVQSKSTTVAAVADQNAQADFTGITPAGSTGDGVTDDSDTPKSDHLPLPAAQFKWTLMMFINADNDLEEFGVGDVNEMESLPDSDQVRIVVLMDRTRGFDVSNGNWTDARRFVIRHDEDTRVMTSAKSTAEGGSAEVLGELDTGNAKVFRDFVDYAMRAFPAEHYLVDSWNHGSGWRTHGSVAQRGVLFDDTQNTYVSTPELLTALDVPANVDIALFDSSLMQMMEVAYQIRNRASFMVGSEESPPGEGYPYDTIFRAVIDNPDITPEAFAAHIVNSTVDALGAANAVTQSALRTSQLATLRNALSGFADALARKDGQFHSEIAAARNAAQRYGSGSSLYEGNRDLIDFIDQVNQRTSDSDLLSAGQAVKDSLTAALAAERHAGSNLAQSHGLAIWIPNETDWSDLRKRYLETAYAQGSRWDEWLDVFYGVGN